MKKNFPVLIKWVK